MCTLHPNKIYATTFNSPRLEHGPQLFEYIPPDFLLIQSAAKLLQPCPTLCDLMDCSPPGSSVHGILQERIPGWIATSFSRGSSPPGVKQLIIWVCVYPIFPITMQAHVYPPLYLQFSSVQLSHSVVSNSLRPHESQHARPPCPSQTPRVYSNSCPSSR